tara:strand:+ start:927 stop:1121 length:195 start_codon:yes stop_codon:yes gene_type:complete
LQEHLLALLDVEGGADESRVALRYALLSKALIAELPVWRFYESAQIFVAVRVEPLPERDAPHPP